MKDVKRIVNMLVKTYDTRNPFRIADYMNIGIEQGNMGSIKGCFIPIGDNWKRLICINNAILTSDKEKMEICAHELGHAIMHCEDYYFYTMENVTYRQKAEIEADMFAAELLIPDDVILEHPEYTKRQIASCIGCSEKLVEFKKFRQNEKR